MDERDAQIAAAIYGSGSVIKVTNMLISARVWQAALFVGLLLWLCLIARTAIPAL